MSGAGAENLVRIIGADLDLGLHALPAWITAILRASNLELWLSWIPRGRMANRGHSVPPLTHLDCSMLHRFCGPPGCFKLLPGYWQNTHQSTGESDGVAYVCG